MSWTTFIINFGEVNIDKSQTQAVRYFVSNISFLYLKSIIYENLSLNVWQFFL